MEKKLNTYFGRGHSDYLYAKAGMEVGRNFGDYNGVASMCAQSAEKYLKAVLEQCVIEDDVMALLHSHNLRAILNRIKEGYANFNASSKDVKWLGDFYFDARYPGDNFVVVSEEDALECLRIVEELEITVRELLEEEEKKRNIKKEKIENLDTFSL
ncbi:MAG: HEPN domain-containing protein [Velocimicrobium sp.]